MSWKRDMQTHSVGGVVLISPSLALHGGHPDLETTTCAAGLALFACAYIISAQSR